MMALDEVKRLLGDTLQLGDRAKELTAQNRGKPRAIAALRAIHPYQTVVMVGDGITDLEAVQVSHRVMNVVL